MQCPCKFVGAYAVGDGIEDARLSIDDRVRKAESCLAPLANPSQILPGFGFNFWIFLGSSASG